MRVVDPSLPKVGAVCGKAARTVLCGGRSAMSIPTAIEPPKADPRPVRHRKKNGSYPAGRSRKTGARGATTHSRALLSGCARIFCKALSSHAMEDNFADHRA